MLLRVLKHNFKSDEFSNHQTGIHSKPCHLKPFADIKMNFANWKFYSKPNNISTQSKAGLPRRYIFQWYQSLNKTYYLAYIERWFCILHEKHIETFNKRVGNESNEKNLYFWIQWRNFHLKPLRLVLCSRFGSHFAVLDLAVRVNVSFIFDDDKLFWHNLVTYFRPIQTGGRKFDSSDYE